MDPSITCFHFMGNSKIERGVVITKIGKECRSQGEEFVIIPLSSEKQVLGVDGFMIIAIARSDRRELQVGPAIYDPDGDGIRYRWTDWSPAEKKRSYDIVERRDNVFSRVPMEVKIAASTTVPQRIRV